MTTNRSDRVESRALLLAAFVALAALFATFALVTMRRATVVRRQTRALVQDALAGVELVSRVGRDIDRVRLLLDAHILESEALPWSRVEARIHEAERDYTEAARAYDEIATEADEAALWRTLRSDLAALVPPMARALELSRQDLDPEARRAVQQLDVRFDDIDREVTALVAVNRAYAEELLARAQRLQRSAMKLLGGLALLGIAISLFVGVSVTRRVTTAERELRRSSALLEEQNRELDAFAGRVAHDLRGHLAVVTLASSSLARAPDESRALALLGRGVARMHTLIEDLLTLSRLDAEAPSVCDPAAAMAQVQEDLSLKLESETAALQAHVEAARVTCSEGLLRQLLWNLIDNAVKYRRDDEAPRIEVEGVLTGRIYRLSVRDNGIGMAAEEADRAFEPLFRGARGRERAGSGLGLAIVKRIVESAGGAVSLESETGKGSQVIVELPVAPWKDAA